MASTKATENETVTGLENAKNPKEASRDLVSALLAAADFKNSDDAITKVDIKRFGEVLFSVHIHPISDSDNRFARKKATVYMPNPNGKKLPPIEKEVNSSKLKSWMIYLATTEKDQKDIWGNPVLMEKYSLAEPWESVDILLAFGEKNKLFDMVCEVSGLDDEGEYAGDEDEMDAESFQS